MNDDTHFSVDRISLEMKIMCRLPLYSPHDGLFEK